MSVARPESGTARREVEALVLGGGISGIAACIRLRRDADIHDVLLIEKSHQLGGTWNYNTYPGCACDIPSSLYSFEFAPNPEWSRVFAPQPEILDYVKRVADEFGVTGITQFGTEVTGARWDETSQRWLVDTNRGGYSTPIFVFGVGALNEPTRPDVPGVDSFEGVQFHSARWDHEHDLTGERVAVIGSGASAIQLVPQIQPEVKHLTYLQRTAGWVWPKPNWRTTRLERALYRRFPAAQRALRAGQFLFADSLIAVYLRVRLARLLNLIGRGHLFVTVRDRELRKILTPTHDTGCKRIMIANDYYPSLVRDNVTVVPHGLREVRPHSIVSADGTEHPVDTIIWATGFRAVDPPFIENLIGRDGRSLSQTWKDNPRAYMGASINGFPNAFMMWGPNSGTGCNFVMVEAQLNYVIEAVRALCGTGGGKRLASLDIRPDVVDRWKAEMTETMSDSTWTQGGCNSWYQDPTGEIHAIYGGSMRGFLARGKRLDLSIFDAVPAPEVPHVCDVKGGSPWVASTAK